MISEEWWKGKHKDGREGTFPSAYVELTGEYDVDTAEEEAKKWEMIESIVKQEAEKAEKRRMEAEKEMEQERLALEEATRKAAEARAKMEAERVAARTKQMIEEQEKLKQEQAELARKREEAEKQYNAARDKLQSMRIEQDAAVAKVKAVEKRKEKIEKDKIIEEEETKAAVVQAPSGSQGGGYMARRKVNYAKPSENDKFKNLGGGDVCKKCGKGVGVMEKMLGPAGSIYHKECL